MAEETNIFNKQSSGIPQNNAAPKTQPPQQQVPAQQKPAPYPENLNEENPLFGILKKAGIVLISLIILFILIRLVSGIFAKKPEKVDLTYWGLWEDPVLMKSIISDFERENPNITINYSKQDIKDHYRQKLTTRIQNGNGPDIYRFHNSWLPQLSNYLTPLPLDVISKEDFKKNFYPTTITDLTKNGGIFGIPLEMDTLSLFINEDIFKAAGANPPTDWNQFGDLARSLTVKDTSGKIKTSGAALGTFDNINHASDIISLLFVQNGVDLSAFDKYPQQEASALTFYSAFANGDGNVWDNSLDPSLLAFIKGNLAMYFGYSWDVLVIKAANPNLSFQVVEVPHLTGTDQSIASYWAEGISSKTKHQKEAFLFLKFLAKKETETKLFTEASKSRLFGEPYARQDLAGLLKDNQLIYPFVSQAPKAKSTYFSSNTFDDGLNDQMNAYLGNAIRSMSGNTSAESADSTLISGVAQVLSQFGSK